MGTHVFFRMEEYMGVHKNKAYNLRLEKDIMDKVRLIAEKEDRPLSKQFERIIKEYLESYEKENGTVIINIGHDNHGNINL